MTDEPNVSPEVREVVERLNKRAAAKNVQAKVRRREALEIANGDPDSIQYHPEARAEVTAAKILEADAALDLEAVALILSAEASRQEAERAKSLAVEEATHNRNAAVAALKDRNEARAYTETLDKSWFDIAEQRLAEREQQRARADAALKELAAAQREAVDLAKWLHRNCFAEVTQWEPLDTPAGVLSQLDNMLAGLVYRRLQPAEAANAALLARIEGMAGAREDEIAAAFEAGCWAVQENYQPHTYPEFGEAARDYAQSRAALAQPASEPKPQTHDFVPHPKWPWFCKDCGYAPHEPLKHTQASSAPETLAQPASKEGER